MPPKKMGTVRCTGRYNPIAKGKEGMPISSTMIPKPTPVINKAQGKLPSNMPFTKVAITDVAGAGSALLPMVYALLSS